MVSGYVEMVKWCCNWVFWARGVVSKLGQYWSAMMEMAELAGSAVGHTYTHTTVIILQLLPVSLFSKCKGQNESFRHSLQAVCFMHVVSEL